MCVREGLLIPIILFVVMLLISIGAGVFELHPIVSAGANSSLFIAGIAYAIYYIAVSIRGNRAVYAGIRVKCFIPLAALYAVVITCTIFMIPHNAVMIASFGMFLAGYLVTYVCTVVNVLVYRDPVVKIGTKSPYLIPFLCFLIPTLIMTSVYIPRDRDAITGFSITLCLFILTFGISIRLVLGDLRRMFSAECSKPGMIIGKGTNRKRLVLINPVNHAKTGLTDNTSSIFPPLGLGIIAALTPDDFDIVLIDENIEPFVYCDADLVAITAFTSAANRAYEIAAVYRAKGVPVVMGGIHASMNSEEALNYVDTVVIGEAESSWGNLINDFRKSGLQKIYRGELIDMKDFIVPRRDIFSPRYLQGTIQTSRGCPMDCYFCSVTPFNGKVYRQRPVEDVLNELESMKERQIFFVDDNLLGYSRESAERAIALFKGMVERKLNKEWFCQASLNFGGNDEVLKWAAKSGCRMVFIGLESPEPDELKSMHKNLNLKMDYDKAFQNINRHGIAVLGAFIFGSDAETVDSIRFKTAYMLRNRIDVIQTTILTPLPGTRQYDTFRDEDRLIYRHYPRDWDRYDMSELTYTMKNIDNLTFITEIDKSQRRIYSMRNIINRFIRTLRNTGNMNAAFYSLASNMVYRNVSLQEERN